MKSGLFTLTLALLLSGCGFRQPAPPEQPPEDSGEFRAVMNRVDIPPSVRRNLGITFAKVELRSVASTLHVPGVFEAQPFAHRAYHATLAGKAEILVKQYQQVAIGDPLIRVESPAWREMQQTLIQRVVDIRAAQTRLMTVGDQLKAVTRHHEQLQVQRKVWADRLEKLEALSAAVGGTARQKTEALAELAKVDTELAEAHEEDIGLRGEHSQLTSILAGYREATPILYNEAVGDALDKEDKTTPKIDVLLARAASLLGLTSAQLQQKVATANEPVAQWRLIEYVDVVAKQAGVVEKLEVTNGAWVDTGDALITTVDASQVRFRGVGLQADLAKLRDGLQVQILPPGNIGDSQQEPLTGKLAIGLELDPVRRTIDLLVEPAEKTLPHWARSGVSTQMEIVYAGGVKPQLAIPKGATIKDGLELIIFRRDPKNPNKVIRIPADIGIDDGRWVTVKSGLMEGDEVVTGGIYELMLASGGDGKQQGGHFHADGTYHEGSH